MKKVFMMIAVITVTGYCGKDIGMSASATSAPAVVPDAGNNLKALLDGKALVVDVGAPR
ncbi:MAG: hypothetical protein U1F27_01250 [Turneriella sp.]